MRVVYLYRYAFALSILGNLPDRPMLRAHGGDAVTGMLGLATAPKLTSSPAVGSPASNGNVLKEKHQIRVEHGKFVV